MQRSGQLFRRLPCARRAALTSPLLCQHDLASSLLPSPKGRKGGGGGAPLAVWMSSSRTACLSFCFPTRFFREASPDLELAEDYENLPPPSLFSLFLLLPRLFHRLTRSNSDGGKACSQLDPLSTVVRRVGFCQDGRHEERRQERLHQQAQDRRSEELSEGREVAAGSWLLDSAPPISLTCPSSSHHSAQPCGKGFSVLRALG